MAVWKCKACSAEVEARCKPGKCPSCGAGRDNLLKQEKPSGIRKKPAKPK